MSSVDDTSIDKSELQKRLREINEQVKNLSDEMETIELKLQENFGSKKQCITKSTNNNEKNNFNTNTQSSNNNDDNNNILEEERLREILANSIKKKTFDDEILKNFGTLKFFFEEIWNVDFFGYEIDYPDDEVTDRQKAACIKMTIFTLGHYFAGYEEKIQKAQLKFDVFYDLPDDELKPALEDLFDALITRSKVLELYENCGKEAGKLYENVKGVSTLQIESNDIKFYLKVNARLRIYQKRITWNYEKFRATFEFWRAGFNCQSKSELINMQWYEFQEFKKELLDFLNEENLEITEEQKPFLRSILKAGKEYCDK